MNDMTLLTYLTTSAGYVKIQAKEAEIADAAKYEIVLRFILCSEKENVRIDCTLTNREANPNVVHG